MRVLRWTWIGSPTLLASSVLFASIAGAQDVNNPATTADSSKETLIPELRVGDDEAYVQIYGQINKGLLVYGDGRSTLGYFPVDNDNSSTRAGITLFRQSDIGWSVTANVEAEWTPYSTSDVNQLNHGDFNWDSYLLRKAEVHFNNHDVGRIWLGQGSMASDVTAEIDLSGTNVVGYSDLPQTAGGQFFRLEDGPLSSVTVGDAFNNFDGLSRKFRARYDTPSVAGFRLGASVGTQIVPDVTHLTVWDIAAKYENTLGNYEVAGAIAYSRPNTDELLVDGSISVLHDPSGLNLTVAGAYSDAKTRNSRYVYVKLGYQTDIIDAGKTAFSVDAYLGSDVAADHSDSQSIGAQLVQNLDYLRTELYLGGRVYSYDDVTANFDDGYSILAGARTKF